MQSSQNKPAALTHTPKEYQLFLEENGVNLSDKQQALLSAFVTAFLEKDRARLAEVVEQIEEDPAFSLRLNQELLLLKDREAKVAKMIAEHRQKTLELVEKQRNDRENEMILVYSADDPELHFRQISKESAPEEYRELQSYYQMLMELKGQGLGIPAVSIIENKLAINHLKEHASEIVANLDALGITVDENSFKPNVAQWFKNEPPYRRKEIHIALRKKISQIEEVLLKYNHPKPADTINSNFYYLDSIDAGQFCDLMQSLKSQEYNNLLLIWSIIAGQRSSATDEEVKNKQVALGHLNKIWGPFNLNQALATDLSVSKEIQLYFSGNALSDVYEWIKTFAGETVISEDDLSLKITGLMCEIKDFLTKGQTSHHHTQSGNKAITSLTAAVSDPNEASNYDNEQMITDWVNHLSDDSPLTLDAMKGDYLMALLQNLHPETESWNQHVTPFYELWLHLKKLSSAQDINRIDYNDHVLEKGHLPILEEMGISINENFYEDLLEWLIEFNGNQTVSKAELPIVMTNLFTKVQQIISVPAAFVTSKSPLEFLEEKSADSWPTANSYEIDDESGSGEVIQLNEGDLYHEEKTWREVMSNIGEKLNDFKNKWLNKEALSERWGTIKKAWSEMNDFIEAKTLAEMREDPYEFMSKKTLDDFDYCTDLIESAYEAHNESPPDNLYDLVMQCNIRAEYYDGDDNKYNATQEAQAILKTIETKRKIYHKGRILFELALMGATQMISGPLMSTKGYDEARRMSLVSEHKLADDADWRTIIEAEARKIVATQPHIYDEYDSQDDFFEDTHNRLWEEYRDYHDKKRDLPGWKLTLYSWTEKLKHFVNTQLIDHKYYNPDRNS